jgi:hypothetical protein
VFSASRWVPRLRSRFERPLVGGTGDKVAMRLLSSGVDSEGARPVPTRRENLGSVADAVNPSVQPPMRDRLKTVRFTEEELSRVRWCTQTLGITYEEFIHIAVLQSCDEIEGVNRALLTQYTNPGG